MVDIDGRGQHRGMKLADLPPHWQISAICLRCSHCAPLPVSYLVSTRQIGPRTTLADLEEGRMLRCARPAARRRGQRGGHRHATSRETLKENPMDDVITPTASVVDLDAIQRIVVQPALLASDPDAGAADGLVPPMQMGSE
jgi:hypothetical protein